MASQVGNVHHPEHPGLEDFGDVMLRGDGGSRLHPRRLVHARRPARVRRRAPHHPRQRRLHRAAQVHGHRRPPGRRPPADRRPEGRALLRLQEPAAPLRRAPRRRRAQPHRDRHAPAALLPGDGAGDEGGEGRAADQVGSVRGRGPAASVSPARARYLGHARIVPLRAHALQRPARPPRRLHVCRVRLPGLDEVTAGEAAGGHIQVLRWLEAAEGTSRCRERHRPRHQR